MAAPVFKATPRVKSVPGLKLARFLMMESRGLRPAMGSARCLIVDPDLHRLQFLGMLHRFPASLSFLLVLVYVITNDSLRLFRDDNVHSTFFFQQCGWVDSETIRRRYLLSGDNYDKRIHHKSQLLSIGKAEVWSIGGRTG